MSSTPSWKVFDNVSDEEEDDEEGEDEELTQVDDLEAVFPGLGGELLHPALEARQLRLLARGDQLRTWGGQ